MSFTYPLPQSQKKNLDAWLDTLTEVVPTNEPNTQQLICAFCEEPTFDYDLGPLPDDVRDPGESIIRLPCGCQLHRGCAIDMLHPEEDGRDECRHCGFKIFEQSDRIEKFIDTLRRPSLSSVQKEEVDDECSICRGKYIVNNTENTGDPTAEIEHPVQLSCNHVFGNHCLHRWLSLNPSCPTCRREVIIPHFWPTARQENVELENTLLRERIYWNRYFASHIRVHDIETADEMDDRAWLDAQVESTVANFSEWVDETEEQRWERRASIRESLLKRVMDRARRKLDLAARQLVEVEMMEAEGTWEVAADTARWYELPGF